MSVTTLDDLREQVDSLGSTALPTVDADGDLSGLLIDGGDGAEVTAMIVGGEPERLVLSTRIGDRARLADARLRALLDRQRVVPGPKLVLDTPTGTTVWARHEIALPADITEVRAAFWSLLNARRAWFPEVLHCVEAEPVERVFADDGRGFRPVAMDPLVALDVDEDTLARRLCTVAGVDLDDWDEAGGAVILPDGETLLRSGGDTGVIEITRAVATVPDGSAPGLGRLLRRQGELPFLRIDFDEFRGEVGLTRAFVGRIPHPDEIDDTCAAIADVLPELVDLVARTQAGPAAPKAGPVPDDPAPGLYVTADPPRTFRARHLPDCTKATLVEESVEDGWRVVPGLPDGAIRIDDARSAAIAESRALDDVDPPGEVGFDDLDEMLARVRAEVRSAIVGLLDQYDIEWSFSSDSFDYNYSIAVFRCAKDLIQILAMVEALRHEARVRKAAL